MTTARLLRTFATLAAAVLPFGAGAARERGQALKPCLPALFPAFT